MPALPPWPPRSLPRLFVDSALAPGASLELDQAQANYLGNVLRRGLGDELLLFDGSSGEWLARIADSGRKRMRVVVERPTRPAETLPDLSLAFAPVKRAQVDWLIEKATELGVARLVPVRTERTIAERVRLDRLKSIAIEAAEQCGRTVLPEIEEPTTLPHLLDRLAGATLYFADETGGEPASSAMHPGPAVILTGPEGGFTSGERDLIRACRATVQISLGPRILRAETAALAAVAAYMALAGDWR